MSVACCPWCGEAVHAMPCRPGAARRLADALAGLVPLGKKPIIKGIKPLLSFPSRALRHDWEPR